MNQPTPIRTPLSQAEETLRLVANLPAPAGLEARIQHKLHSAPAHASVLPWPSGRGRSEWRRGAAAAALVAAVCGGSWAVYSRVQPTDAFRAVEMPRVNGAGSFSNAGAMRTPQTLAPAAAPAVKAEEKPTPEAKKKSAQPEPAQPGKN